MTSFIQPDAAHDCIKKAAIHIFAIFCFVALGVLRCYGDDKENGTKHLYLGVSATQADRFVHDQRECPERKALLQSGKCERAYSRRSSRDLPFPVLKNDGRQPTERELATIRSVLTDDFLVNDDTSGGTAYSCSPSIAMNGSGNFVVVWTDFRDGYPNSDIYCQRYNSSGVAQGVNFKVNDDAGVADQICPSIALDGSENFIVVWEDGRNGNADIYCQRYDSSGTAQGANLKVNDDAGDSGQGVPSIAIDGSGNFVVVWIDNRNGNWNIYCQRYNSSGIAKGINFKVNDGAGTAAQWTSSIAMDGSGNFVVAWEDYRNGDYADIYCQRYDSSGTTQGVNFKVNDDAGAAFQFDPSIAMDGSGNFVVVWENYRNGNDDIYCQRYNSSGAAQGVNFKINDDVGTAKQGYPSIAMDGSGNFVVVWIDNRNGNWNIYCQQYNSTGVAKGVNFKTNDETGTVFQYTHLSIAMDGSGNCAVVWTNYRKGNYNIYCQQYNTSGATRGVNFKVNDDKGTVVQDNPSITMDVNGNFVIVWQDYRNGNSDIYCQRYNSTGVAQGLNIKVNDDTGTVRHEYPSVAMDENGNFVVVWMDWRNWSLSPIADIYCQRYNASGTAQGINFKANEDAGTIYQYFYPSIAMDGNGNLVVVWTGNGTYDIYCQRYNSSGAAQGVNFKINDADTAIRSNPSIAIDGSGNFVVVWMDNRNGNSDIYCQRYNSSGTAQGVNFKVNDDTETTDQEYPSIAMDGSGNFVVVWEDSRNGKPDIYCQRYNSSGVAQGANFKVNDDAGTVRQEYPSIAMDGSGGALAPFVVVWTDYRYGMNNPDVIGQRYYADGSPWGTNYRIVADGPNHGEEYPAVAANANTIVFAWMDNRRSKGWDIYGKVVGWDGDGVTAVSDDRAQLPKEYGLSQNYPNPFNPLTIVNFQLPIDNWVTLKVYDLLGREVATLVDEKREAGRYEVQLNASNLASGVYFYRLQAGIYVETKKLILMR